MKIIERTAYLLYYIKETDFKQTKCFLEFASKETGERKTKIIADMVKSVYKYNVSFKDYFCFRFYALNDKQRKQWAGTGFMYEYQLRMNPKAYRNILEDKIKFLNHFKDYVYRKFLALGSISFGEKAVDELLNNPSGKLVLKGSMGQVGAEVKVVSCSDFDASSLIKYMKEHQFDLVEEFVVQHESLMDLSPSGLNTIRIFTELSNGNVKILGSRLRITVNSPVDNMAAGNIAAPVDNKSGIVCGPGVYSDITKRDEERHPVTGKPIQGFQIPFWDKTIEMVKKAALHAPDNKSVGWDVAISQDGPELIEGNHNWCKLLWQLPVKRGLKAELN